MIVAIPEFIFWILYLTGDVDYAMLFDAWVSSVGLYGSCLLYAFTVLFPAIQLE